MFLLLIHVFSLCIILQTLGFIPSDSTIPKLVPLFHTVADVPSRYPCKLPSVHCLNSLASILQLCYDTPKLARRYYADAKVFTDMPKCYTVITLQHLFHFGMCVWVCNVGWITGVCQVLGAALTLFEPLAPVKHCCMLQTVVTVHMLHSRMNVCWSCTFHTHTEWMMQHCVPGRIHDCPPLSIRLFCREVTQSSLLMTCACLGWQ
jgi:hypothetical protein